MSFVFGDNLRLSDGLVGSFWGHEKGLVMFCQFFKG